jgi:hypothetical protein
MILQEKTRRERKGGFCPVDRHSVLFEWICSSLDLDPKAVRRSAFSLAATQTAELAVIRAPIQSLLRTLDT